MTYDRKAQVNNPPRYCIKQRTHWKVRHLAINQPHLLLCTRTNIKALRCTCSRKGAHGRVPSFRCCCCGWCCGCCCYSCRHHANVAITRTEVTRYGQARPRSDAQTMTSLSLRLRLRGFQSIRSFLACFCLRVQLIKRVVGYRQIV